jgi:hypothetical protein
MGTYSAFYHPEAKNSSTEVIQNASKFLQHIFASFIRNPASGLEADFGWPRWEPNSTSLAQLFENNKAEMSMVSGGLYDAICANPPPIPWDQI